MKNLKDIITESKAWEISKGIDGEYAKGKDFMYINTETHVIAFYSKAEIESWEDDFAMYPDEIKCITRLKPGQMYDADGGITIYVRIA